MLFFYKPYRWIVNTIINLLLWVTLRPYRILAVDAELTAARAFVFDIITQSYLITFDFYYMTNIRSISTILYLYYNDIPYTPLIILSSIYFSISCDRYH